MKTAEIKELTTAEIQERLASEKEALVRMKLNHSISPLDNPLQIRWLVRLLLALQPNFVKEN